MVGMAIDALTWEQPARVASIGDQSMATRYGVCLNSMGWTGRAGPARDRLMPDVPSIDAGLPQKASAGATQRAHLARHAGPPQEHGSIKGERRRVNALRPAGPLRLLPGTLPVADGHHPGCGAGPCFDSGPDASRSAVAGYLSICCQAPVLGGSIGRTQGRAVRCCLMPMPVSMPASAAMYVPAPVSVPAQAAVGAGAGQ